MASGMPPKSSGTVNQESQSMRIGLWATTERRPSANASNAN